MFKNKEIINQYKAISNNISMPELTDYERDLNSMNYKFEDKKKKLFYKIAPSIIALGILVGGFWINQSKNNQTNIVAGKNNNFSIVAYADKVDKSIKLKEGISIELPWGKFSKYGFEGNGFNIKGKNIDTINIKTTSGELSYFDKSQLKEKDEVLKVSKNINIIHKESDIFKEAKELNIIYDGSHENGMNINWMPDDEVLRLDENNLTNYDDIESTIITIKVKYEDGIIQENKIVMSVNSEGYILAELEK